jgi:hypothetical protein
MKLTDLQIKCLLICDCVRWGETKNLTPYNYHLLRRQMAFGDPIIHFEMNAAADFVRAYGTAPPKSPPPGPQRSPWLVTYGVDLDEILSVEVADPLVSASTH